MNIKCYIWNLKERGHLADIDVDRTTLKCILEKLRYKDVDRINFTRIGSSGGLL
jgi:hypothetical protein